MNLVRLGNIFVDGTKIQASASRHKAMSYEYMKCLEEQLEAEIDKLLELAAAHDEQEKELQLDVPEKLRRRKDRLEKIKQAQAVVEARTQARYQEEKQEYEQKLERGRKKEEDTGKKPRGKAPQAPDSAPKERDQYNWAAFRFTDPESRIMKTCRGFEQCYNGQAVVNEDMIIVGGYSNAHGNDKKEFGAAVASVPQELGVITAAVVDTGYFSEQNIKTVQEAGIEPIIAVAREQHNSFLKTVLNQQPAQTVAGKMKQRLSSKEGGGIYKKRKQTVEPVFGIIKEVMGFIRPISMIHASE